MCPDSGGTDQGTCRVDFETGFLPLILRKRSPNLNSKYAPNLYQISRGREEVNLPTECRAQSLLACGGFGI